MDELDYELPPGAIATRPAEPRDQSRLLVYRRAPDRVEHRRFCDLPGLLERGDLLVVNETKVLAAKLLLRKVTGALIPGLFLGAEAKGRWRVMLRSRGKLDAGAVLRPAGADKSGVTLRLLARATDKGQWIAEVTPGLGAAEILERIGHVPLPPYIEKARGAGQEEEAGDRERYQTVYAREAGAVAAPTAGLHFTQGVFDGLTAHGIATARVTLHVGLGTFLPVEAATLEEHKMHAEEYVVPAETVAAVRGQRGAAGASCWWARQPCAPWKPRRCASSTVTPPLPTCAAARICSSSRATRFA